MGHAVVSAKRVSPHPVFYVSRALSNARLTIAPKKKFTLSKAIMNDLLHSVIYHNGKPALPNT